MIPPAIPKNEPERLRALRRLEILDTDPEPRFDGLTAVAAHLLNVPIALVSLVDADRQWFKSRHGLDALQTPRDVSFCGHVVANEQPLVVPDAHKDERFRDNPLVTGDPRVRFYAGIPLRTREAVVVGTLCAIDHLPRSITPEQQHLLELLARQVEEQLEMRYTNRKLVAQSEELLDVAERMRAIVDTAADAILTIDASGTIESFNRAAESMTGWRAEEARGKNIAELLPAPVREACGGGPSPYFQLDTASPAGTPREVTVVRKDGTKFPAELSVSEMVIDGRKMFTGMLRDISERKRMDQIKAQFVSTVSHELRTPLTSIVGYLDVLLAGDAGPLSEEQRKFLGIVSSSSLRLSELVSDLLDIEKLDSGLLEFERCPVDLAQVLSAVEQTFRMLGSSKGIAIGLDAEPGMVVEGDEKRLVQVFSNLVSNAVKYTREGSVRIEARNREGCAVVRVVDTGIGMSLESVQQLFTRFFRAEDEYTRMAGGTGLGLSIAKAIVEQHGGSIAVESQEGRGSVFTVSLPSGTAHRGTSGAGPA